MAAMAGLLQHSRAHAVAAGQALTGTSANPMAAAPASTPGSSDSSTSGSSTISANDFLTLLVTEMQNQDPTANTDPNEYINQLVQVNSLEQLIDINQNISTALGTGGTTPGSTTGSASSAKPASAGTDALSAKTSSHQKPGAPGSIPATQPGRNHSSTAAAIHQFAGSQFAKSQTAQSQPIPRAPGNLSVPATRGASHRVAHSLDGHAHPSTNSGKKSPGQ